MAMLHYLKPLWGDSVVVYCNTGAAYPETLELMARVQATVPRFRVVHTNQPEVILRCGYPVDVVPVRQSLQGDLMFGPQPIKYQSYFDCCRQNIWEPMHRACLAMGVDTIYRGQRKDDVRRAPISSGATDPFGMKIVFPIHGWTRAEVLAYLKKHCPEWLAAYYETEKTSRDCWSCTAYRDDNEARVRNLPDAQREIVEARIAFWQRVVRDELREPSHAV